MPILSVMPFDFSPLAARWRQIARSSRRQPVAPVAADPALSCTAPDGMLRNVSLAAPRVGRADAVQRAKRAAVPQREQVGPTCGLYALGMVLDAWHLRDPRHATALVSDVDLRGKGKQYTLAPTTDVRLLPLAQDLGFTSQGEMFTAAQLAATARAIGYDATTHHDATLADLYRVLDAGHPAIVAFDVDQNGNPGDSGGARAHYAVIQGYFDDNGTRYLVARHGWAVQADHVWKAADFDRSWRALEETSYYGTPGDDVIPGYPGLHEPAHLNLPDVGRGRAGIRDSLACKIVEVVPLGEAPVGGVR